MCAVKKVPKVKSFGELFVSVSSIGMFSTDSSPNTETTKCKVQSNVQVKWGLRLVCLLPQFSSLGALIAQTE